MLKAVQQSSSQRQTELFHDMPHEVTHYSIYASPIGELLLTTQAGELTGLFIIGQKHAPRIEASWVYDELAFQNATYQLDEYFGGSRTEFDLPLKLVGSDFQQRVWNQLAQIPYGTTTNYGELAKRIDNPRGSRAVGLANGRNPISIIVPCHRVVGANGDLTGYGGGLAAKRWLLDFEAKRRD
jgi:methylated-DNA-[protein]-cysteine S-methyltransferase